MTDEWLEQIDAHRLAGAVILDFSAAFNLIDHEILLKKLECYGFLSPALSWMRSYLSARKQRVFFNGSCSSSKYVHCGVPQGSCLGPLLYSIFTDESPCSLEETTVVMYVDDSTLYCAAQTADSSSKLLNSDLEKVCNWVKENELVLNIVKTTSTVFGSKFKLANDVSLNLSTEVLQLKQVIQIKLLGITLDSYLSWTAHTDDVVAKMGKGISMARRCITYIPAPILKRLMESLALSHLEYCLVMWSSAAKKELHKLQLAQNRAARLVLRCSYRTNVITMHKRLSRLTVESRLLISLLSFLGRYCPQVIQHF